MTQGRDLVIFWKFWLEGVLLPIVGTFGVAGRIILDACYKLINL